MKTMSQIEYQIDELLREKENLKEQELTLKAEEFAKILLDLPPQNIIDLQRVLMMFAKDVKNIVQQ